MTALCLVSFGVMVQVWCVLGRGGKVSWASSKMCNCFISTLEIELLSVTWCGQLSLSVVFKNRRQTLACSLRTLCLCQQSPCRVWSSVWHPSCHLPCRAVGSRCSASYCSSARFSMVAFSGGPSADPQMLSEPLGSVFTNAGLHSFKLGLRLASQNTPRRPPVREIFPAFQGGPADLKVSSGLRPSHSTSRSKDQREDSVLGAAAGGHKAA